MVWIRYQEEVLPPAGGQALNGFPREWSWSQVCQSLKGVWTMLSGTGSLLGCLCRAGSGTQWSLRLPSNLGYSLILWTCSYSPSNFSPSEPFQVPLWGGSKDLACSHPQFLHHPLAPEAPQPLRRSGVASSDRDLASLRPCHRLREENFDFNRTRNIRDHSETT